MQFGSIEEIIEFAIQKEEEAAQLYADLANKVNRPGMREVFLEFAQEEQAHKGRLLRIQRGELPAVVKPTKVQNLKLAEQMVDVKPSPQMTYQEALLFAMKSEKAAFKMYSDLAAAADGQAVAEVFRSLAQEEAKHKLRFEIEYDEQILEGN